VWFLPFEIHVADHLLIRLQTDCPKSLLLRTPFCLALAVFLAEDFVRFIENN
jgi:hypothetical protein